MLEPMTVRVEVWPLAADSAGLWLAGGDDAWRSIAVLADGEPHTEVEYVVQEHAQGEIPVLVHSTSWRTDGPSVILTYVAVFRTVDAVRDIWPSALPITADLAEAVGKPPTHSPVDAPTPRYIDVLMHGIRHLRFLLDHDATSAAALDVAWRTHLAAFTPALAEMYDRVHEA